ncbi:MAG: capsule assembly Wzi family protein, partial [Terriglobales bacterium]
MSQVTRTLLLLLILTVSLGVFADDFQNPRKEAAQSASAADRCTDLSGKAELPGPSEAFETTPVESPEPAAGPDRCTDVSGKIELPCPSIFGSEASSVERSPSLADTRRCTDVSGKIVLPCPSNVAVEKGSVAGARVGRVSLERSLARNILLDQKAIWTSPLRLRDRDVNWFLPFVAVSAGLIGGDTGIEDHLPDSPSVIRRSRDFSNYGTAAFLAGAGGFYLWGRATHNDHMRETGLLSGEALINSFLVTSAMKGITQRQRPFEGDGKGRFWEGGSSFPSEHAAAAWSVASVIAHEYPGPLTQILAYGAASAVSATRVTGRKHFASDVFIGSALGWYIGRQVYRAHHDSELDGSATSTHAPTEEKVSQPDDIGSPYVPLDTWIYPAFDRLAAMGYVQTTFAGLRPWTRVECARLVEETEELLRGGEAEPAEAYELQRALQKEFEDELQVRRGERNRYLRVESIYGRFTGIFGTPLADSYHFGQTVINDFGRPFSEGANVSTGFSLRGAAGRFAFYVRGEYQRSPQPPPLSEAVRQAIAVTDEILPSEVADPTGTNTFRLLDTYASVTLKNMQISVGKQSLWWGPGTSNALIFSNNAEPIYMVRIARVEPFKLPSFLGVLGPAKTEFFFGKLVG